MISVSDISRQDSFSPSAFCSLKCFMWVHTIDDVSPGGKKRKKKAKNNIYKIHKYFTRDSFSNMGISGPTREGSIMAELRKEGRKFSSLVDLVKAPLPMGR